MLPLWVPSLTSTARFTHMRFVSLCLLMPQLRARFERLETGTISSQSSRRKCTMSKSQLEISSSSVYLMILSILPGTDLWPWLFQLRFNLTFSFSFWQRHRSQAARCLPALEPSFALSLATGPVRRKTCPNRVPTGSQPLTRSPEVPTVGSLPTWVIGHHQTSWDPQLEALTASWLPFTACHALGSCRKAPFTLLWTAFTSKSDMTWVWMDHVGRLGGKGCTL